MARGLRVSAALAVLAALAAGADAGSAVAWLEGGDAPSQPPPRSHAGRHGASPHELDALRRRLVPAKGEEDMTVAELSLWHDVPLVAEGGRPPVWKSTARRVYWHRVDGVEVDAAIQEHAVKQAF